MQGIQRKVVYITLYEGLAIACSSVGLVWMSDGGMAHAGALAVMMSMVAIAWNLLFTLGFERWEARQARRGRSLGRRVVHAIGFEGGLVAMLVPLVAWWLDVSLWQALVMDVGLMAFFLVYTFSFNWAFDRVFGLPTSAMGGPIQPA